MVFGEGNAVSEAAPTSKRIRADPMYGVQDSAQSLFWVYKEEKKKEERLM